MSAPAGAAYTFLPWVRRGLARAITTRDEPAEPLTARVTLPVRLRVDGAGEVTTTVRLHGPGDVTGLDARQVVRTDPQPGATGFEPGYMPQIQFARADLPWLFTPAAPGGERLRPWLVLVTVRRHDGVRLDPNPGSLLPALEIASPASPAAELPDLAQSWAWAHAQITGLGAGHTPAELLETDPGRACSRLVCPRRLEPDTAYLACVVPAFLVGVRAGLGEPVEPADEARLDPAWSADAAGPLRLPVYYSWEFTTGAAGSFETLVRRLHPGRLDGARARPPRLDLTAPGGGMPDFDPAADGAVVGLQSALRLPGQDEPPAWPDATRRPFQAALERLLTAPAAAAEVVTAPVYGQVQAGADALPPAGGEPAWLRECNLDPRWRAAAAVGTRVVQLRQEQLMARAWEQAGAVRDVNALLHRSQMARELGTVLIDRHLRRLSAVELLALTQPAHARLELTETTVDAELRASRVPDAVVSGAMRRLASPRGLVARRALQGALSAPIDLLGAVDRMASAPAPGVPAGMVAAPGMAARPAAEEARPAFPVGSIQFRLLERLRPEATVLGRTRTRVDAPEATWTRADPLAPVATGPRFPEPMYQGLQEVAPWLFLPGLEHVETDSVMLLEASPHVIEAYMVGLNHEMSRELLWREFPADLGATPFRQFWDVRGQAGDAEALADIPLISEWAQHAFGAHLRGADRQLVLLVRGELLRRYPATTIFAARANADGTLDPTSRLAPMFRGTIAPDIAFVGFSLSEQAAAGTDPVGPGWYFGFEEHPGEPRFGFDEVAGPGVPRTPDDLAWPHVPLSQSGHADAMRPLLSAAAELQAGWGHDAAGMARLSFQRPFRVAMHASRLLPGGAVS
jgi:hypothetical protein